MKRRLDLALVARGLAPDRARAQALILGGRVRVAGEGISRADHPVADDAEIQVEAPPRYVSRGGLKLEGALDRFGVQPAGRVCADLGASTGGFTDCLLQRGASRVYAIDVGYGILDWKLRSDPRVVVMERTNARTLDRLPEPISLLVGDLSFISLRAVLPSIARLAPGGECVLLVKPQFEAERDQVRQGKVEGEERAAAIAEVLGAAAEAGFSVLGSMDSPVPGAKAGNVEALVHLHAPEGGTMHFREEGS